MRHFINKRQQRNDFKGKNKRLRFRNKVVPFEKTKGNHLNPYIVSNRIDGKNEGHFKFEYKLFSLNKKNDFVNLPLYRNLFVVCFFSELNNLLKKKIKYKLNISSLFSDINCE